MIPRRCIYLWCNRLREVVQSAVQDELECSGQVLPKVWNGVDCVEHCIEAVKAGLYIPAISAPGGESPPI